jgi:predicted Zn-dependent peptidase
VTDRTKSPLKHNFNPDSFGIDSLLPEIIHFNNGITCYQINKGSQDLVKIEFLFDAGTYFQNTKFSAFSAIQLLTEGTKNFTSQQISQTFDFFGAYIEKEIDRDFAIISFYCLNKYIDNLLPLIEEIIKSPTYPENEIELFKEKQKSQLIINREKVNFIARTKFTEIIFGKNHPYGTVAELADIKNLTREDVLDFHKKQITSTNCKILISGKITKSCIEKISKFFGSEKWGDNYNNEKIYTSSDIISEKKNYIIKDNAVQSAMRIGKEMFNFNNSDYFNFQLLNTIFGGYFGSRLMKNIREDKGYTYGIGSAIIPLKHSGFFFISTEVGAEYTQKTLDEIYKEIENLCNNIIEEEELNLVKNYKFGEFIRGIDGAFAIAEVIKPIILYNLDFSYYKNYLNSLKSATSEDMYNIANKYFKKNDFVELVVGLKKI